MRFDFQGSGRADLKNQIGCQSNGENAAASHVEMPIPTSRFAPFGTEGSEFGRIAYRIAVSNILV